jgi:hypothetical protein
MRMTATLKHLSDFNPAEPLNSLLRHVQKLDTKNTWGKRSILLSSQAGFLDGFQLNRNTLFHSVVRTPLNCIISRKEGMAKIEMPQLTPGLNFHPQYGQTVYKIVFVLGEVPDIVFENGAIATLF